MGRSRVLIILISSFFAILTCCAHPSTPVRIARHEPPRVVLDVHGDTEFTVQERADVAEILAALEYQTAGMLRIGVTYDLDFSADVQPGGAQLVRALSTYPWVEAVEPYATGGRGRMLGLTLLEKGEPPRTFLLVDRLEDRATFRHVAMHELLHAVGLDHVPGGDSVMSAAICSRTELGFVTCPATTCLSASDAAEFCRVAHCRPAELNVCGWGA